MIQLVKNILSSLINSDICKYNVGISEYEHNCWISGTILFTKGEYRYKICYDFDSQPKGKKLISFALESNNITLGYSKVIELTSEEDILEIKLKINKLRNKCENFTVDKFRLFSDCLNSVDDDI